MLYHWFSVGRFSWALRYSCLSTTDLRLLTLQGIALRKRCNCGKVHRLHPFDEDLTRLLSLCFALKGDCRSFGESWSMGIGFDRSYSNVDVRNLYISNVSCDAAVWHTDHLSLHNNRVDTVEITAVTMGSTRTA